MKKIIVVLFAATIHSTPSTAGIYYCDGLILDILTRSAEDGSQIRIEGMNGWARIGFGGETQKETHRRQLAMALLAFQSDKRVALEIESDESTCEAPSSSRVIRSIRLGR